MSSTDHDGLPTDPDGLLHLGISAAIAITTTDPHGADIGMALAIAARREPPVFDAWRRVPVERPVWLIERSDGGGGYRSGSPPDGEPVGPPYVLDDPHPATRVLRAVNERLGALADDHADPVIVGHVANAERTLTPGFTEEWLRSLFADPSPGPSRPAETWAAILERAIIDFAQFSTTGAAASVVVLGAVLGDALDQGPLAAGALGMLQSRAIARWGEPFDVGHAVWPMVSYVASRGGYEAIESTVDQLLAAGDRSKDAALDSTSPVEFGFGLRKAALEYSAAALGSMAMLDADDGSLVTNGFRRSATVADERQATVGVAVGRWALGYDGSELRRDQARISAIRAESGDRAAARYADRLIERMWFHPRAALEFLLHEP